jgi:hypothetical protein
MILCMQNYFRKERGVHLCILIFMEGRLYGRYCVTVFFHLWPVATTFLAQVSLLIPVVCPLSVHQYTFKFFTSAPQLRA